MKNDNSKYVLPSNSWFRKHISNDLRVFYKTGSGYGGLDVISSGVGMYYLGSALVVYENKNGKLELVDVNIILPPT